MKKAVYFLLALSMLVPQFAVNADVGIDSRYNIVLRFSQSRMAATLTNATEQQRYPQTILISEVRVQYCNGERKSITLEPLETLNPGEMTQFLAGDFKPIRFVGITWFYEDEFNERPYYGGNYHFAYADCGRVDTGQDIYCSNAILPETLSPEGRIEFIQRISFSGSRFIKSASLHFQGHKASLPIDLSHFDYQSAKWEGWIKEDYYYDDSGNLIKASSTLLGFTGNAWLYIYDAAGNQSKCRVGQLYVGLP